MKTKVKLLGQDGNAFNLIGLCVAAARKDKWPHAEIKKFEMECFSADDYDHLLRIIMEKFYVE